MRYKLFKGNERGTKDIGWLQSNFTFSFSTYANPERNGFGLLKVFNDDYIKKEGGFGLHPHMNMEIISILLAGSMNHKDTMGYSDIVHKDWVQIMSAGTGLKHEEYNVGEEDVNFLQIWIEPKMQNISPRYQRRSFPKEQRKNKLQTAVSNEEGQEHCWINQNAKISLGYFDAGKEIIYSLNRTNKCVFVFVVEGNINVENEVINKRDAIGLWETGSLAITTNQESEFVIIEVPINH